MSSHLWRLLQQHQDAGEDLAVITVIATRGSVPGETGSKLTVTPNGRLTGTVGGGKIEARAITTALDALKNPTHPPCASHTWNLQRDIGMTCGGEMTLLLEIHRAHPPWNIALFGAGHIVQALVPILTTLACRITVIDNRPDWLAALPHAPNLQTRLLDPPAAAVDDLTDGTFALSITQGHSTDLPVLTKILQRPTPLPFVGVIGSAAKRAVLTRELRQAGIPEPRIESLVCPIGLPIGDNSPPEIALSIAAQLLQIRGVKP